ncbi:RNA polymerase sigma factor [Methylobacterium haplocladii]|uniref:RNA polymerase sigma factor n=3 Tax=Methylobacterium haplocladii TaxID=1176176 RepID=A0A512IRQ9_9HYPH|nr:RNA polymerase sigma factor [Methylobacterium haplocladii]GLS58826.1 RNA polymerase sigma factor [Methylobacterium haplocladii]
MEAGWSMRVASTAMPMSACLGAVSRRIASWLSHASAAVEGAAFAGEPARPVPGVHPTSSMGGAGFRETVLPHLDAAYNLARFLTRDADAADDIVQDAFLRAFRGFDGFRGGDARAWLLTIVRNCARSWATERSRVRALCEPLVPLAQAGAMPDADTTDRELFDPDQDTPESALLRESEASLIRRLIEALPDAFREVLILREFDDLSYKQIADVTETPIGTVMSRLARARQMLGEAWRGRSGEDRP